MELTEEQKRFIDGIMDNYEYYCDIIEDGGCLYIESALFDNAMEFCDPLAIIAYLLDAEIESK